MARILFFCPDFPQPSGGTKRIYRYVQRLNQLGFDAAVVHQKKNFVLTWHGYAAPVLWLEDRPQFHTDDTLVIPEVMLDLMRQTQKFAGRRVVLALSWAPAYNRLKPGERWQDYGITQAITVSPVIKRYLEWSMGINVTLIHEYVDATRYSHQREQKKNQIAYLTRKDASGAWLQTIITRRNPTLTGYTWQALRDMDEATYAQHLQTSTVYLATTLQEGMHVSVLEAMACGCLVVGYAGVGGHAYLVGGSAQQNCILVENGNLPLLGETLEQVLLTLLADPRRYDSIIENALAAVRQYQDEEAEIQSLQAFFATNP